MTLTEALKSLRGVSKDSPSFDVFLACGFTSLHLETFLAAHLQQNLQGRRVVFKTGLYGDTTGTLESLSGSAGHAVVVAVEWPDLDLRLGYREPGRWGPGVWSDVVAGARAMLR